MSDILKQIQALQEQFNNLFEVDGDGLGQPAVDIPPSQNKIKKDVKTKNGKAELVSVEDELFPYDGNKREQYRQKIIDTINGMIQGTSTLEDLLQIVRQKKAPLKEAMEILENVHYAINKRYKNQRDAQGLPSRREQELHQKALSIRQADTDQIDDENERMGRATWNADSRRHGEDTKSAIGMEKTQSRQRYPEGKEPAEAIEASIVRHEKKEQKKAPLKEAMEVLERILDKNVEKVIGAWNAEYLKQNMPSKTRKEFEEKVRDQEKTKKKAPLKEAMELMEAMINELYPDTVKSALHAHNKKTIELEDKVNKRIGEIFKKHGIKGNTYSAATAEDRQKAAETEKEIKEDPEIKDLHNQQEKRAKKNELYRNAIRKARKSPIEEALSLMEAIINEVSERTKIDAYKKRANQSKLIGDIAKDTAKWHMDKGAYGPAIEVLKKADTAQKKEFKHRLNTMLHDKAFGQDAYNKAAKELHDEWKVKKDIKEALSLTEEIINEVSIGALARAVENNLPKRKKNEEAAIKAYKQAQDEYEKDSKESPEDEAALYKKLQCTDKAACKEFDKARDAENLKDLNLPKDSKVSANKLFNAAKKVNPERQKKTEETVKNTKGTKEDAKKFLNSLKRDNRSFDISLADPVKSRADEALEEALAIINEVSKKFMAPRLEAGAEKAEQISKRKEEIIADPKKTEKEKDEAAKENAAYQCKAINVTNDAVNYEEKKQKKNK